MEPTAYLEFPDRPAPSCVNCGFIGVDWRTSDGESRWKISQREERTTGDFVRAGATDPTCWRAAADLHAEVLAIGSAKPPRPSDASPINTYNSWVLEVIDRHRPECHRFQPWTPQWSVEQHLEEHKMHLLEKQRREYEGNWKNRWLPLWVAIAGIVVSALLGWYGSQLQADATIRAAEMQLQASPQSSPRTSSGQP